MRIEPGTRVAVYTTQVFRPGGFETLSVDLAGQLLRLGALPILVSHHSRESVGKGLAAESVQMPPGLSVEVLDVPVRPGLRGILVAAIRLRRLIRRHRIDALEVSGFAPSIIAGLSTAGLPVGLLVGVHDDVGSGPLGLAGRLRLRMLTWVCRRATFYCVSGAARDSWIRVTGCKGDRAVVVHNSCRADFCVPRPDAGNRFRRSLGVGSDERIVLCVGRIMLRKGQLTVLDAFLPLLEAMRLRLVFLGRADSECDGDSQVMDTLARVAAGDGVGRRVHLLGERLDLPDIMAAADLLVHVPRKEAFGVVLIEAMASGLPVIASNVGGIPEVLSGTDSLMIEPDDPAALRSAFSRYLEWGEERRRAAVERGRMRAAEFSVERRALHILDLLSKHR